MKEKNTDKNAEISANVSSMLEYLGVTPNKFAQALGYDRSQTIYDIINGKSAPSFDFFRRFQYSEYSDIISIDWLLTSRGEMLRQQTNTISPPQSSPVDTFIHKDLLTEKDERISELKDMIAVQKARIKDLEEKVKKMRDMDVDGGAACAAVG